MKDITKERAEAAVKKTATKISGGVLYNLLDNVKAGNYNTKSTSKGTPPAGYGSNRAVPS
jgi:hypothetical protein